MRKSTASFIMAGMFVLANIYADTPISPPKQFEIKSPSKKYIATIDPDNGVEVRVAESNQTLWATKHWFRIAFLADDGEHLVTGYGGANLLPVDYETSLVLVTFWQKDQKIREITVADLIPNRRILKKTASHYHWGHIESLSGTTLTVKRCDDKLFRFDIRTGKEVK